MNLRPVLRARGWLLALAAVLLVTAVLLPPLSLPRAVARHMVVFDITQSMNVVDREIKGVPASRLAFARHAVVEALGQLPCGSEMGVAIFSNRRTLLLLAPVEICSNRPELTQTITRIDSRMAWEQASVIFRGVHSAINLAAELPTPPTVMFFTDGQEAPPMREIPPLDKPPVPVRGTLLGVGGMTAQPIPRSDPEGRPIGWWTADAVMQQSPYEVGAGNGSEHLSALREPHLRAVAAEIGFGYVRLDSAEVLQRAMTARDVLHEEVVKTDLRWIPAALAALLLACFYLPLHGIRRPERWRMKSSAGGALN